MIKGSICHLLSLLSFLSLLLISPAQSQVLGARNQEFPTPKLDSPTVVTTQYLLTAQRLALFWIQTKPWPSRYLEYLNMAQEEFAPMLSQVALDELRSKPQSGPKELVTGNQSSSSEDKELYEGMVSCVAKAHFTVLEEEIAGDQATVEVETTVNSPFGSGKIESFQDKLTLIRENGRWVLTPQAFKTFFF